MVSVFVSMIWLIVMVVCWCLWVFSYVLISGVVMMVGSVVVDRVSLVRLVLFVWLRMSSMGAIYIVLVRCVVKVVMMYWCIRKRYPLV